MHEICSEKGFRYRNEYDNSEVGGHERLRIL
jgi:hypothetical protein